MLVIINYIIIVIAITIVGKFIIHVIPAVLFTIMASKLFIHYNGFSTIVPTFLYSQSLSQTFDTFTPTVIS